MNIRGLLNETRDLLLNKSTRQELKYVLTRKQYDAAVLAGFPMDLFVVGDFIGECTDVSEGSIKNIDNKGPRNRWGGVK